MGVAFLLLISRPSAWPRVWLSPLTRFSARWFHIRPKRHPMRATNASPSIVQTDVRVVETSSNRILLFLFGPLGFDAVVGQIEKPR
jgi:hypothetical protein